MIIETPPAGRRGSYSVVFADLLVVLLAFAVVLPDADLLSLLSAVDEAAESEFDAEAESVFDAEAESAVEEESTRS